MTEVSTTLLFALVLWGFIAGYAVRAIQAGQVESVRKAADKERTLIFERSMASHEVAARANQATCEKVTAMCDNLTYGAALIMRARATAVEKAALESQPAVTPADQAEYSEDDLETKRAAVAQLERFLSKAGDV
jgi:hypothetical protein